MPWHVEGKDIVNDETGKVKSHHASKEMAQKALRALYANVPEARRESHAKHRTSHKSNHRTSGARKKR